MIKKFSSPKIKIWFEPMFFSGFFCGFERCGSAAFPNFRGGIFPEKCVRTNLRILRPQGDSQTFVRESLNGAPGGNRTPISGLEVRRSIHWTTGAGPGSIYSRYEYDENQWKTPTNRGGVRPASKRVLRSSKSALTRSRLVLSKVFGWNLVSTNPVVAPLV